MANLKVSSITTSDITNTEDVFTAPPRGTDGVGNQDETEYTNPHFKEYFGYYKEIPELQNAINMRATWAVGSGYDTDATTEVVLDGIRGSGRDTFLSIIRNMVITRQINGDAYAEIIRDEKDRLINLKPLDPASMKVIFDRKGRIKRYEQVSKLPDGNKTTVKFEKNEIFHLTRNRIADEIHGTSVVESCKWIIDARNEAMMDYRTVMRRNVVPLRVVKVDLDDPTKIDELTRKYETMIKNKEVLFIPQGTMEIENVPNALNSAVNPTSWIELLKGYFYQAVGVPEILMGGGQSFSESSAKISYLGYETPIREEQRDIEQQILNQLFYTVTFKFPASLKNELLNDESKDAGAGNLSIQPNDVMAGVGK